MASRERIAGDQDFKYIEEDIGILKKQLEERRVSLNITKRQAELSEQEARRNARKAERAKRASKADNIFEIDLEGANGGKKFVSLASLKQKAGDKLASVDAPKEGAAEVKRADPETDGADEPARIRDVESTKIHASAAPATFSPAKTAKFAARPKSSVRAAAIRRPTRLDATLPVI